MHFLGLKKAGHTVTDLYPTEVPILSNESFIRSKTLQGLSLRNVELSVYDANRKKVISHQMDMLFTHFGISGPATLRCSQFIVKLLRSGLEKVQVSIDAIPEEAKEKLLNEILLKIQENPKRSVKNLLKGIVPERYLDFILIKNNLEPQLNTGNISREMVISIVNDLKDFRFDVHGSLPLEKAFVTGGGVSIKEIVPSTMQSKLMNGLYFCGEVLDIHGYTGGYNITAALVTGRVAGMHAAWESLG